MIITLFLLPAYKIEILDRIKSLASDEVDIQSRFCEKFYALSAIRFVTKSS